VKYRLNSSIGNYSQSSNFYVGLRIGVMCLNEIHHNIALRAKMNVSLKEKPL
jgi:hypothetical protein